MLFQKLLLYELKILKNGSPFDQRLEVLSGIKVILSKLDLGSEIPSSKRVDKLIDLMEDLKESSLTAKEREMLLELVEVTNEKDGAASSQ